MTDTAAPPKPKRQGNYKAGPGRPPGRKNNKTLALEEATRQAAASIDGAFEGDAHGVAKPVLSAVHGRMDVNFNLATRLEAARKRVARINGRGGFGEQTGATLELPAQIIDVSPDGQERA